MNYRIQFIIFLFFYCFCSATISAQNITLKIISNDSVKQPIIDNLKFKKTHQTKIGAFETITSIKKSLNKMGFINNTINTTLNDSIINCNIDLNSKIDSIKIYFNQNDINPSELQKITNTKTTNTLIIPFHKIEHLLNGITKHFEFKGFSFVETSLDQISVENPKLLSANLIIQKSIKRTIDKVNIKGYTNFPNKLIQHEFNIKKKSLFNKNALANLDKKIKSIPYLKLLKPSEVLFSKDSTILYVYVEKQSTNKASGIIGFSNEQENNSIQLNGNAHIELTNSFNKGEHLKLNWNTTQNQKKELSLRFFTPYIYNSIISPSFNFILIKQDSSFINTSSEIELKTKLANKLFITPIYRFENSKITTLNKLPNFSDYTKQRIGISFNYINSPNNFINLGLTTGEKKETNTTTKQHSITAKGAFKINLHPNSSFIIKQTYESLRSKSIVENEMYQVGGFSTIRGFDESSILTNHYSITNIEYHQQVDPSISINTITDFGYIENQFSKINSKLYTIGLGFSILSRNNLLNLSYALGKINNSSFKFNNSKVHINIVYFF